MKTRVVIAALLALTIAGRASAASNMSWLGVQAGGSIPTGDLGDVADPGFVVAGTFCYPVNEMWGIGADLGWHKWGKKNSIELSSIQYTANVRYMFPAGESKMHPYAKAGVGAYSTSVKDGDSSTDAGFNIGGGVNWMASDKMSWGLDAAYHYISSEGDAANMITAAVGVAWGVGGK